MVRRVLSSCQGETEETFFVFGGLLVFIVDLSYRGLTFSKIGFNHLNDNHAISSFSNAKKTTTGKHH